MESLLRALWEWILADIWRIWAFVIVIMQVILVFLLSPCLLPRLTDGCWRLWRLIYRPKRRRRIHGRVGWSRRRRNAAGDEESQEQVPQTADASLPRTPRKSASREPERPSSSEVIEADTLAAPSPSACSSATDSDEDEIVKESSPGPSGSTQEEVAVPNVSGRSMDTIAEEAQEEQESDK